MDGDERTQGRIPEGGVRVGEDQKKGSETGEQGSEKEYREKTPC